jgi:hypothetical protein
MQDVGGCSNSLHLLLEAFPFHPARGADWQCFWITCIAKDGKFATAVTWARLGLLVQA